MEAGRRRAVTTILPAGLVQRGLTRLQAAAYVGIPVTLFDSAVKQGVYPAGKLPGGNWDLKALDGAIDRLSNLAEPSKTDWEALARGRIHEAGHEVRNGSAKR